MNNWSIVVHFVVPWCMPLYPFYSYDALVRGAELKRCRMGAMLWQVMYSEFRTLFCSVIIQYFPLDSTLPFSYPFWFRDTLYFHIDFCEVSFKVQPFVQKTIHGPRVYCAGKQIHVEINSFRKDTDQGGCFCIEYYRRLVRQSASLSLDLLCLVFQATVECCQIVVWEWCGDCLQ
jgi:hypothetical protein